MPEPLSAFALMEHVYALARDIGPRPAGSEQEAAARRYVCKALHEIGILEIEEIPFLTHDTWGYSLILPTLAAFVGSLIGGCHKKGRLLGGLMSLFGAYSLWRTMRNQSQLFFPLYPKKPSATLIARLSPSGAVKHRIVLIGHMDTNKHRPTFGPGKKQYILASATLGTLLPFVNGLAQLAQTVKPGWFADVIQRLTQAGMAATLALCLNDESGGFVEGANDNATAVACLLGLGAHLKQNPLRHTEIWLAFTGAEETGLFGTEALLHEHGCELRDAWFLDFEMVGSHEIAYVTRHSGLSYLGSAYRPDPESLAWAEQTSAQCPDLQVKGRAMVINEEIGTLVRQGYHGICLVGVGPDGYLENWHQYADNAGNIKPAGMEKAARFALAMMHTLDAR